MTTLIRWLRDLCLAADTTTRGLLDDPLQFCVQVARRLRIVRPPKSSAARVVTAYRWYLADHPDRAAETVAQLGDLTGMRRRLARRLAVQLGVSRADGTDPARLRALDLSQVGALSEAAATAPRSSRLAARLASERDLLTRPVLPISTIVKPGRPDSVLFLLTNSLPHTRSGYTLRSHAMLTALRASGVRVDALTRIGYPTTIGVLGAPLTSLVDEVAYYRLPAWRLPTRLDDRIGAQVKEAAALVERLRPGLLHCTTDYTNALVTKRLSERFSLPWVYEMRGQLELTWIASRPAALRESARTSERVRLLRAMEAELAGAANAVIVLSEVQREDLISRGVAAENITVVPNAVDPSLFDQDLSPPQARVQLGLDSGGIWVGSVSSVVGYEGFDVLVEAVAQCRASGVDIRCAVVGDGVSRPGLVDQVHRLGLEDVVILPGRRPHDEAALWHQSLDIFAVPRRDHGVTRVVTPLKPIEAMALGRPVVASDLPALAELTSVPGTGVVVTPDDPASLAEAITRLATDPGLRADLAERGRSFAAGRTWSSNAEKCRGIYQRVCGV